MKVAVFGYHNFGYVCLQELLKQGHDGRGGSYSRG